MNDNTALLIPERKPISKKKRVLLALIDGRSFNRFEAERNLNDHVLNSTVSDLQHLGIVISRHRETVPGYCGSPTSVCRYWIAIENRDYAERVLRSLR